MFDNQFEEVIDLKLLFKTKVLW